MKWTLPASLVFLFLAACMKAPDPAMAAGQPQSAAAPLVPSSPSTPQEPSTNINFSVPSDWTVQKVNNGFTLKKWGLPGGGVCTVTAVGGDIGANFQRWASQFDLGNKQWKRESLSGAVYATELMRATGTLLAGAQIGGGEARRDWSLIGAAIPETPIGSLYVKVLGPAEILAAQEGSILQALKSLSLDS